MKQYIFPAIVKIIIVITFYTFIISSLSPGFMFGVLGDSNTEPFGYMYSDTSSVLPDFASFGNEKGRKEIGIIVMLTFLAFIFVLYILYRMLKSIYRHYKTTNKAIKKDV